MMEIPFLMDGSDIHGMGKTKYVRLKVLTLLLVGCVASVDICTIGSIGQL